MGEPTFSLDKLVPKFGILVDGNFSSPESFSSAVVAFLLVVLTGFILKALYEFATAHIAVRFYQKLIEDAGFGSEQNTELNHELLAARSRDILNSALKNKKYGRLWREFHESLVQSPDGSRLSNTLDASHFFNTHTLARGLTENRLIAAVPGFLTAIGVIGTFAGLQMGLANLNLEGDQDVDTIKKGIAAVTNGAAIAFMTSVWGVGTSVFFNFLEKILERSVRGAITDLQNQIDYLYPRTIAEQSLVKIADFARSSHETMQGLAEKIGDRLQEAMLEATSSMSSELQSALSSILAPAVDSLVNNANKTSEGVIKDVVSSFSERLGQAGNEQRQLLEEATGQINLATQNLATQLSSFSDSAATQKDDMTKTFEELMASFVGQFESLNRAASDREAERHNLAQRELGLMQEANQQSLDLMVSKLENQLETMGDRGREQSQAVTQKIEQLGLTQGELTESIAKLIQNQKTVHTDIANQLRDIQSAYRENVQAQNSSSEAIRAASFQMHNVSERIQGMGESLEKASEHLGENISNVVIQTQEIVDQNQKISESLSELSERYNIASQTIQSVSQTLNDATIHAKSGFEAVDQHLDSFTKNMQAAVESLERQMEELMISFANQVSSTTQERMNEWNQQTSQYTSSMTAAIDALAGVVDDIDNKASRRA